MNILFLDDSPERTATFLSQVPSARAVATAAECIAALAEPWDVVFLDHDLGGQEMVASGPGTGMEVVEWIVEHQPAIGVIICHSLNRPARTRMYDALEGYQRYDVPFAWVNVRAWL